MIREARMAQLGFFDAEKRLAALSAKGDPLEAIDRLVPWESFRADIEAVVLTPDEMRSCSNALTSILRRRATWRVAGRWLMPRSWRCRDNATAETRTTA